MCTALRGPNDEEGVIDPEDLDITKNEEIHKFDDGQYVIATGYAALDGTDTDRLTDEPTESEHGESEATRKQDPRAAIVRHMQSTSAT